MFSSTTSLAAAALSALTLFQQASAAPLVTRGSFNDGCALGSYRPTSSGSCAPLNSCVFLKTTGLAKVVATVTGLAKIDANAVIDLAANACVSLDTCTAVKTHEAAVTSVAGWSGVRVCQVKTCRSISVLVSPPAFSMIVHLDLD